jgi:hypothetical protein
MEEVLSRNEWRLSDYFDGVAGGALVREQGEEGTIHGRERAPLVYGEA